MRLYHFTTAEIPAVRVLPPVPQSARVACSLPLSARLTHRRQVFLRSAFVADVVERRYLILGCALVLALAVTVAWLTRGTYWTGTEWAPIPTGGTR